MTWILIFLGILLMLVVGVGGRGGSWYIFNILNTSLCQCTHRISNSIDYRAMIEHWIFVIFSFVTIRT